MWFPLEVSARLECPLGAAQKSARGWWDFDMSSFAVEWFCSLDVGLA